MPRSAELSNGVVPDECAGLSCIVAQKLVGERDSRGLGFEVVVVLSVSVLPLVVSSVDLAWTQRSAISSGAQLARDVLSLALHWLLSLLLVAYVVCQRRERPRHIGWCVSVGVVPSSLALFAAAMVAYVVVFLAVGAEPVRDPAWTGRWQVGSAPPHAGALLLLLAIGSPVFEEIVVRGYFMTRLSDLGCKPVWCVLASATVQTLYHMHKGPILVPAYAASFLVFSAYFARYRNLLPVILAHFYIDIVWWSLNFLVGVPR